MKMVGSNGAEIKVTPEANDDEIQEIARFVSKSRRRSVVDENDGLAWAFSDRSASTKLSPLEDANDKELFRQKITQEVLNVEARLADIKKNERYLIRPDTEFMAKWDLVLLMALLFTALVTPYEVAFLETSMNGMFAVNRFVDFIFIIDMVINFNLIYLDNDGRPIKAKRLIAKHYLGSWFPLDFITVLPYDSLALMPTGDEGGGQAAATSGHAQIFRLFRVLRLLKLLRMSRAARILERWETRIGISAADAGLMGLFLFLTGINHWLACLWGLGANIQDANKYTWMTAWLDGQEGTAAFCKTGDWLESELQMAASNNAACEEAGCDYGLNAFYRRFEGNATFPEFHCWQPEQVYAACLHWSMMTVTSIGYGDITPTNTLEYIGCVVFMLVSGVSWAMIIGRICGLAAAGDPVVKQYNSARANMDRIMEHMHVPPDLRQSIRMYMKHTKSAMEQRYRQDALQLLSPSLVGQITDQGSSFMTKCPVSWMVPMTIGLRSDLLKRMGTESYPPKEEIPSSERMNILKKGTLAVNSPLRRIGHDLDGKRVHKLIMTSSTNIVWNEDMVLRSDDLRMHCIGRTITYVEIDYLERSVLESVLADYPIEKKNVRTRILWLGVFRMVVYMSSHQHLSPIEFREKHGINHSSRRKISMTDPATKRIIQATTNAMNERFDSLEKKLVDLITKAPVA